MVFLFLTNQSFNNSHLEYLVFTWRRLLANELVDSYINRDAETWG